MIGRFSGGADSQTLHYFLMLTCAPHAHSHLMKFSQRLIFCPVLIMIRIRFVGITWITFMTPLLNKLKLVPKLKKKKGMFSVLYCWLLLILKNFHFNISRRKTIYWAIRLHYQYLCCSILVIPNQSFYLLMAILTRKSVCQYITDCFEYFKIVAELFDSSLLKSRMSFYCNFREERTLNSKEKVFPCTKKSRRWGLEYRFE